MDKRTICISDPHGHFDEFEELLSSISYNKGKDRLLVLGDAIDKGPKPYEMLRRVMEPDVEFILGNHEVMMLEALDGKWREEPMKASFRCDWLHNGGSETLEALENNTTPAEREEIREFLETTPAYRIVSAGGKPFMLVHGGFFPKEDWGSSTPTATPPSPFLTEHESAGATYREGVMSSTFIPFGFGEQTLFDMVWERYDWLSATTPAPVETVHGHTMTCALNIMALEGASGLHACQAPGDGHIIHHGGNKHDIDCGAASGTALGCLVLETMSEHYLML